MAKSNWHGIGGWGTIDDPTGVMSGKVLVGSSGVSATNEDYLSTYVNTSTAWAKDHYSVQIEYAWPSNTALFTAGNLSLMARTHTFTSSRAGLNSSKYGYFGGFDNSDSSFKIVRRVDDVDLTIAASSISSDATSVGSKHTMEFRCYGTTQVTLQLLIDEKVVINTGDTTAERIVTGQPGLHIESGTTYIDNFTTYEYTATGESPALWTPTSFTGTLAAWWRADAANVTTVLVDGKDRVSAWTDNTAYSNDLSQAVSGSRPEYISNAVNSLPAIDFDGSDDFLTAIDSTSLDLNSSGLSILWVAKNDAFGTGVDPKRSGIAWKGDSYEASIYDNGVTNSECLHYRWGSGGSDKQISSDNATSLGTFQLQGIVTNKDSTVTAQKFGFWRNGSQYGNFTTAPVGADNADALYLGTGSDTKRFDGQIAEVIIVSGEASIADRQKLEGYLAWRYGLQGLLQPSHPYKSQAPTV